MDWLAGSRQHILELLITRTLVLAPIFVLGFSKEVIDAYIVIVGFQAVFNHANVSVRLGPLRYVIVTPNFHHWHHSQDDEAIDRTTPRTSPSSTTSSAPPCKADRAVAGALRRGRRLRAERLLQAARSFRSSGRAERAARRRALRRRRRRRRRRRPALRRASPASAACTVLLLDHAEKVAEKIRISGGGRCNFTNRDAGAGATSCRPTRTSAARRWRATRRATSSRWSQRHGIAWHEKHKGQLFCDDSSEQIIDMLLRRMRRRRRDALAAVRGRGGARRRAAASSSTPTRGAGRGARSSSSPPAACRSRRSAPATSATALARQFGHRVVEPRPALVPLTFDGAAWAPFAALAGVSLPVRHRDRRRQARGELRRGPAVHPPRPERPGGAADLDASGGRAQPLHDRPGARRSTWRPRCARPRRRRGRQLGNELADAAAAPAGRGLARRDARRWPTARSPSCATATSPRLADALAALAARARPAPRATARPRSRPAASTPASSTRSTLRKPARAGPVLHRRGGRRDRLARRLQLPVGLGQRRRLRPGAASGVTGLYRRRSTALCHRRSDPAIIPIFPANSTTTLT